MHTDSQGISENTPTVLKYNYKIQNGDIRCYKELNAARNNGCVFHIDQKLKRNRPWIQDIGKTHFRSGCNLSKRSGAPGVDIDFRQRLNFGMGAVLPHVLSCYCSEWFNCLVPRVNACMQINAVQNKRNLFQPQCCCAPHEKRI